jgi:hypothetical protein
MSAGRPHGYSVSCQKETMKKYKEFKQVFFDVGFYPDFTDSLIE